MVVESSEKMLKSQVKDIHLKIENKGWKRAKDGKYKYT